MRSQVIQIKLSDSLLKSLNQASSEQYISRSAYIRRAVALQLNKDLGPQRASQPRLATEDTEDVLDSRMPWEKPPYTSQ
jgi:metal-responsive CopG/Arc/MetJ family transcriptional regulator